MSTHNIPFSIYEKKKILLNYSKSVAAGFFFKGLKNEFEIAVVNEQSVFERCCPWKCAGKLAVCHFTVKQNKYSGYASSLKQCSKWCLI